MNLNDIVRLWHKTQVGCMHECKKNQLIFADIMWKLWEAQSEELPEIFDADKDCFTYHEEQDHKAMKKEKK
tara:strand:+ start:605 stop:817 length:213 start_codon:yes stop_codon:yes gene_type:complete